MSSLLIQFNLRYLILEKAWYSNYMLVGIADIESVKWLARLYAYE